MKAFTKTITLILLAGACAISSITFLPLGWHMAEIVALCGAYGIIFWLLYDLAKK